MDYTGWLEARLEGGLPEMQTVYVDEAQDHTPLQLAVLRSWPTERLVLFGDDDQCLYSWAGAEPEAFYSHGSAIESVLERSRRVPPPVHAMASRIAGSISRRRDKAYLPAEHQGSVGVTGRSLDAGAEGLAEDVSGYGGTAMVLASCAYMLRPLMGALRAAGVPYHNPYRAAPEWNPLGVIRPRLEAFVTGDPSGSSVASWVKHLSTRAFSGRGERSRLLRDCEGAGAGSLPAGRLASALTPRAARCVARRDTRLFLEAPLRSPSWDYALAILRAGGDWRRPRVIVGTVHSVKGGEADGVWVSPELSPAAMSSWRSGWGADPIRRMFYVAVTRARRDLRLLSTDSWAAIRWSEWMEAGAP